MTPASTLAEKRTPILRCHVLDTGYTVALESFLMRGGALRTVRCHSIVALLEHPEHGWTLFDTGYAPRIFAATRRLPFYIYRLVTPLHVRAELAVAAQLYRLGLQRNDIRRVILSHFHADHVAGLRDFPHAHMIALRSAYEDVKARRGVNALRRAFVPSLLPYDFARRATLLGDFDGPPLPGLGPTNDLFGDGSLLLVELPGHARGQMGALANTNNERMLLAADGCWLLRQVRLRRPPGRVTNVIVDDPRAVRATIEGLHVFMQACPDVRVVPSHCPDAFAREMAALP
jgi:glyoxylase-like metal-dependent hydrolase (beta-lactamase superfamily II)